MSTIMQVSVKELDSEWVYLLLDAKRKGLTAESVRTYFASYTEKNQERREITSEEKK